MNPDYRDILFAFCEENVDFLIVGAYALATYGLPRATGDLDIWVRCSRENAQRIWKALKRFGAPLSNLSKEDLVQPHNVLQLGIAPRRIDILTFIEGVEFDLAWTDRQEIEIAGLKIPVISQTHFIQNKKALDRPQDRADVAWLEHKDH